MEGPNSDVDLNAKIIDALDRKRERRRRAHTALSAVSNGADSLVGSQQGSPAASVLIPPTSPAVDGLVGDIYNKLSDLQDQLTCKANDQNSPQQPGMVAALTVQLEQAQQRLALAELRCAQAEQTSQEASIRCCEWEAKVGGVEMERDMLLAELADPPAFSPPSSTEMVHMGPSDLVQLTQKLTKELTSANQRIGEFELKVARLAAVEGELAALVPLAMRGATHQPDSELEDRITAAQSKAEEQQVAITKLEQELQKQRVNCEAANTDLNESQMELLKWKRKCKALKKQSGLMSPSESQMLSPINNPEAHEDPAAKENEATPAKTADEESELETIRATFLEAFVPHDPDGLRTVPVEQLKAIIQSVDPSVGEEDVQEMLVLAAPVDGRVNYDQILDGLLASASEEVVGSD